MSDHYPHILPHIKDWPIYKFNRQKKQFRELLKQQTFELLVQKNEGKLKDLLAQCAYSEKNRVKTSPWKVDPASEKSFWINMSNAITSGQECQDEANCEVLLKRIISRYVTEILGGFRVETFIFADKFLTYFFNRLFSSWLAGSVFNLFGKKRLLRKKLRLVGYVDETRALFEKGTVVLVPTHQSNLDSVLIGYMMQLVAGLPAFSYGAGLNLYNYEILARYMNRLGAYKVDRRKKNAIYHETLFNFLKLSLQYHVNNLFFPAGGRVRDGMIEQNLKMGLMSSLIQAQKSNCKAGNNDRVYVVPVVLNYHFVLEAKSLVNEYLSKTGREKFSRVRSRKSNSFFSVMAYIFELIKGRSEVVLSFGQPLDVMGNLVDKDGQSRDQKGDLINLRDYFMIQGVFTPDFQRESVYTKRLASSIAASYRKHACVLSSQFMAFICYRYLLHKNEAKEIFDLLSFNPAELEFDTNEVLQMVKSLQQYLLELASRGEIFLDEEISLAPAKLMQTGIQKLGTFHLKRPLKIYSDHKIVCKDLKLLYYYSNRLNGFGWEEYLFNSQVERKK